MEYAGSFLHAILNEYTGFELALKIFDISKKMAVLTREVVSASIAKAEKVRSSFGARGKELVSALIYQYYAGVDLEASFGSDETAFVYSEMLRSRNFLEQLGTEEALKIHGIKEENAQKVRDLLRSISSLQDQLSKYDPQKDTEKHAETSAALSKAEDELAVLDQQIALNTPGYAELRYPKLASLADARTFCGDDRVILEYVLWDSNIDFITTAASYGVRIDFSLNLPSVNSYCLVITKDGITPVRLPEFDYAGNVEALRSKLFRTENYRGREIIIPNDDAVFEKERNALYNTLIKPVLKHIPENIENILIVPDSNLAFLPFDILRENNSPDTLSLGERYSITLSPSVSVSILASQKDVALREPIIAFGGAWYESDPKMNSPNANPYVRDRLAILRKFRSRGNAGETSREKMPAQKYYKPGSWEYLTGSIAEIQELERIATVAPTLIQGRDVSERRVKKLSNEGIFLNYPIVHFACHGFFNDNLTPQAALVFSEVSGLITNESAEDGYLSIEDIALLQLNARMVMLSACETGLGRRGDGMSGLARAFMVAGSQNVGVSLWKINDMATVEFMWDVYHKVIREGKSFREAYREVKEEFRKNPKDQKWNHPYYWAAFTMYE